MSGARYLFERLSDPLPGASESADLLAAIRDNVQRIVATSRGPLDGEAGWFGFALTSPVVLGRDNVVQRAAYMREMATLIMRWERRLTKVVIEDESGAGPLRLVVRARLATGAVQDEVLFPLELG